MLKRTILFIICAVISFSCVTEDQDECITALDCPDGFSCVNGICLEPQGDTGDTSDTGDTADTGNTGDTVDTGDTSEIDEDTAVQDMDIADYDSELPDISDDDLFHDPDQTDDDEDSLPDEDSDITCDFGYESNGITCVDINECVNGTHNCNINADCTNNEGGFTCTCKTNYSGNGVSCTPDTRTNQPCTGLPENAQWNTAAVISQTWNGSDWAPSTTGIYNAEASVTECRFVCKTNYGWNGAACTANLRYDQACTGLPSNASWNTASSITQAWDGSTWVPTTTGVYSETASTAECRYKCNPDYHWDASSCVSNTKADQSCTGLPANAEWNTVSSITQTWNGSSWTPATTGSYNETPSSIECRYKCSSNLYWNGSSCVQCTENGHCGGGTPYCNMSTYICVQCTQNSECNTGAGEVCLSNQCKVCTVQTWTFSNTTTGRTGTIQTWTVPTEGTYRITAYGAQGGHTSGGLGAKIAGSFNLTQGTVLSILVGQRGTASSDTHIGGGGGTFVVKQGGTAVSDIYVIAGGGGGANATSSSYNNRHGSASTSGNAGVGQDNASGGTNGNGGGGDVRGSGGGGFLTNGANAGSYSKGGASYISGGVGGDGTGPGGFGGGGGIGGTGNFKYSGGGGGYSGGGGGGDGGSHCAGGGGSYNNGTNQENIGGNRSGHGYVEITRVCE